MWAYESVFYQIYPLGFCGAPFENDGVLTHRILKVNDWIEHINNLGANAIYFSPVFESDTHGYNTRDYKKIDCRLGTNDDFKEVCENLHKNNIKVVLDGVFNHVGRGFWAFQDVLQNRENSRYRDWFFIDFNGNSNYNDGLWYEGWEGNFDLVKINLRNEEVINHIFECIKLWIDEFDIDGLRLDVAYCLDKDFLKRLRSYTDSLKNDFLLLGELLHGDYNQFVNDDMLHSCTNYECYKGVYSSFNSMNMFEIVHSLLRQFGPEQWTLYRGKHLLSFVDNHDVSRIASILTNEKHIPLTYGMIFGMPGITAANGVQKHIKTRVILHFVYALMSLWTMSFQNLYQNLLRHTKTVKHYAMVISVRLFYKTSTAYLKENMMMNVFLSLSMQTKILLQCILTLVAVRLLT